MVANTFNASTWEEDLSSRTAWSTERAQDYQGYRETLSQKKGGGGGAGVSMRFSPIPPTLSRTPGLPSPVDPPQDQFQACDIGPTPSHLTIRNGHVSKLVLHMTRLSLQLQSLELGRREPTWAWQTQPLSTCLSGWNTSGLNYHFPDFTVCLPQFPLLLKGINPEEPKVLLHWQISPINLTKVR